MKKDSYLSLQEAYLCILVHQCYLIEDKYDKVCKLEAPDSDISDDTVGLIDQLLDREILEDLLYTWGPKKPLSGRDIKKYQQSLRAEARTLAKASELLKDTSLTKREDITYLLSQNDIHFYWYNSRREYRTSYHLSSTGSDRGYSRTSNLGNASTWKHFRPILIAKLVTERQLALLKVKRIQQLEKIDYSLHLLSPNNYVRSAAEKLYKHKKAS